MLEFTFDRSERKAATNSTHQKVAVQWLNQAFTSSKVSE